MTAFNNHLEEANTICRLPDYGKCFDSYYRIEERLQSGSYGIVYRITAKRQPGTEYAAKIIKRKGLDERKEKDIRSEIQTMRDLVNVEGVAKLVDYFVDDDCYIIVQTLARGGDLFDRISRRDLYSEHEARTTAIKLLQTVRVLHERNTVHRDIKPENVLLSDPNDSTSVLLADFGFATCLPKEGFLTRRCGTPTYIAPEVWKRKPYGYACDMWSIGAVIYTMVDGWPPFNGRDNKEIRRQTCKGQVRFASPCWDRVSVDAKNLILGLLAVEPSQRLTVHQALQSNWIQSGLTDALFDNLDWEPSELSDASPFSIYPVKSE